MTHMPVFFTILPYLLLALSIGLFLGLFTDISRKMQGLRVRIGEADARAQENSTEFINSLAAVRLRLEEFEAEPPASPSAGVESIGINQAIRSKVLKMSRLGQSAEAISQNLSLPKGEVELLVKVHKVVMQPYQIAASEAVGSGIR